MGGNFNRALAYDVRLTVEMKDDAERVGGGVMRRKGLAAVLGARLLSTLVEVEKWLKTADTSVCGVRLCGGGAKWRRMTTGSACPPPTVKLMSRVSHWHETWHHFYGFSTDSPSTLFRIRSKSNNQI